MSTLSDVAKRAGVSLATASRAMNGAQGRSVRPELREQVLAAARELDYLPHAAAQTMARGHSNSLGLLVNDIADPHFASIAAGVTTAAAAQGCIVTLSSTGIAAHPRAEVVNLMTAQRVRALIVAGSVSAIDPDLGELRSALGRLVRAGARIASIGAEELGVQSVLLPNRQGATELADALLALGHRRFAVLAGPSDLPSASGRADAFRERVHQGGGTVLASVHSAFDRQAGQRATAELIAGELPDLIFATNDLLALGALRQLREAGLDVPGDIGLAGFGDGDALLDVVPSITSVRLDAAHAGELAVQLVLDSDPGVRDVQLGYQVNLRESTLR